MFLYYFRELRRSAVKRWIGSIADEDEQDAPAEAIRSKLTNGERELLSRAGFQSSEVDVMEYVERQGCTYRTGQFQVLLYGDSDSRQHFGHLQLIVRKKTTRKYLLVVHDLSVEFVGHLGLHKLYLEKPVTTLIKFEHLTTSDPLNLYTSKDCNGKRFNYVTLKETLLLQ